jgi:hypothetical protein
VVVVKPSEARLLPAESDVLGLLRAQAHTVDGVVQTVIAWARGQCAAQAAAGRIHELLADEQRYRRALHTVVRASFSTPLERQDLVELADLHYELAADAYALVREAHLSGIAPDPGVAGIVEIVASGTLFLLEATYALPDPHAGDIADRALGELSAADQAYRAALAGLDETMDVRRELRLREVYRRAEHLADSAARIARRSWTCAVGTGWPGQTSGSELGPG